MKLPAFLAMCAAWILIVAMLICFVLHEEERALTCFGWSMACIVACFILSWVHDIIDELFG